MGTTDKIEKRITLRAPVSRVWRALTDSKEFGSWFGFTFDGPIEEGRAMKGTFNGKLDELRRTDEFEAFSFKLSSFFEKLRVVPGLSWEGLQKVMARMNLR